MDSVPKLTTDAAGNPKPRGRTRFQPGQSGNPKGKPRGAKNRILLALDKIGVDNAAPVLSAAVAAAIGGDTAHSRPPGAGVAGLETDRRGRKCQWVCPLTTGASWRACWGCWVNHAGERDAAAQLANRIVRGAGLTWGALMAVSWPVTA